MDKIAAPINIAIGGTGSYQGVHIKWSLMGFQNGGFSFQAQNEQIPLEYSWTGKTSDTVLQRSGNGSSISKLQMLEHQGCLMSMYIMSHMWLQHQHIIQIVNSKEEQNDTVLELGLAEYLPRHQLRAHLYICSASGLPSSLRFVGEVKTSWKFLQWQQFNEVKFPGRIKNYEGNSILGWNLECEDVQLNQQISISQNRWSVDSDQTNPDNDQIIFDAKKSSIVQGKLSADGRIFVPLKINDQSVGYALLDTGCQHSTIRQDIAKKLDLESYGEVELEGITSKTKGQWCRADKLQIGAVTINNPKFCQSKILPVGQSPTVTVIGFLGFDFLKHVIVDIPVLKLGYSDCGVSIINPKKYQPPPKIQSNKWTQIIFRKNMPVIQARIILPENNNQIDKKQENNNIQKEIIVKLIFDTGGATELMLKDEIYQQLQNFGRQSKVAVYGVGGATLDSNKINVQQLFIGGSMFRNLTCFQIPKQAEAGFQCVDGLLGGRVLDRADVVLDYQNERIAFIPQKRRS